MSACACKYSQLNQPQIHVNPSQIHSQRTVHKTSGLGCKPTQLSADLNLVDEGVGLTTGKPSGHKNSYAAFKSQH